MLTVRRLAILAVIAGAAVFAMAVARAETLAAIGLVAFAAVAQFAPALVASVQGWPATPLGVRAGLAAGGLAWGYTLLVPATLGAEGLAASGLPDLFGGVLNPQSLFGVTLADPLTHGVAWSLGVNIALAALLSWPLPRRLWEGVRAAVRPVPAEAVRTRGELASLVAGFAGAGAAAAARMMPDAQAQRAPPTRADLGEAERLIAQVIGASSARLVLDAALRRGGASVGSLAGLIDDKTRAEAATASKTRFLAAASHDLLQPLNAARLFTAALAAEVADRPAALVTASVAADTRTRIAADGVRVFLKPAAPAELRAFLEDAARGARPT